MAFSFRLTKYLVQYLFHDTQLDLWIHNHRKQSPPAQMPFSHQKEQILCLLRLFHNSLTIISFFCLCILLFVQLFIRFFFFCFPLEIVYQRVRRVKHVRRGNCWRCEISSALFISLYLYSYLFNSIINCGKNIAIISLCNVFFFVRLAIRVFR